MRDNPALWDDSYHPAPSNFDRVGFQKKVDAICGTAKGHLIIRLVYGAEEEIREEDGFTHLGTAIKYKTVGRHRTRVRGVKGKVRKRRFIFEEWQPPQQVPQEAYIQLGGAGGLYVPPSMVDEQKFGKWLELYIVADHSNCDPEVCSPDCTADARAGFFCFGDYREPDGSDLAKLGRITALRNVQANAPDPFQPVSQRDVDYFQKIADEETDATEKMEEDSKEELWADRRKVLKQHTVS